MQYLAPRRSWIARVAAVLAGFVALSVFLYGALLLGAVAHTAARTSLERQAHGLASEVSQLEAQYFTNARAISIELAAQLGYGAPTKTTVVFTTGGSKALSLEGLRGL